MGTAARLRPAAPEDDTVLDHDGADGGIGPGASQPPLSGRQRKLHGAPVYFLGRHRFLPEPLFQGAGDHWPTAATRASPSPESSPSTASKSLASRKLR